MPHISFFVPSTLHKIYSQPFPIHRGIIYIFHFSHLEKSKESQFLFEMFHCWFERRNIVQGVSISTFCVFCLRSCHSFGFPLTFSLIWPFNDGLGFALITSIDKDSIFIVIQSTLSTQEYSENIQDTGIIYFIHIDISTIVISEITIICLICR